MTRIALRRRAGEGHVFHRRLRIRRLVASDARGCTVRSKQREARLVMIESGEVFPFFRRVACFASQRSSRCVAYRHSTRELPLVNVFMTSGAGLLTEMVRHQFCAGHRLVTVVALHRGVRAGQGKVRLAVSIHVVVGGLEGGAGVALVAAVEPGRGSELTVVFILVAVHALRESEFESRCGACGHVALGTFHSRVRKRQRKAGLCMIGN